MTAAAPLGAVPFPYERWAPRLVADPDIEGGGMHRAWAGGFLILRYARPSDSSPRRLLVRVDNGLVRLYSTLKRRLGMSEAGVSQLMRWVNRGRAGRR